MRAAPLESLEVDVCRGPVPQDQKLVVSWFAPGVAVAPHPYGMVKSRVQAPLPPPLSRGMVKVFGCRCLAPHPHNPPPTPPWYGNAEAGVPSPKCPKA